MVRINLINPRCLTDQHLIAEYVEILMLFGSVNNLSDDIPKDYRLGQGHIKFFKNKLGYLKKRHELLKKEMIKRKFNHRKSINLKKFKNKLINDWKPTKKDKDIIKKRLMEKINLKPSFYRYYGKHKSKKFLLDLIRKCN